MEFNGLLKGKMEFENALKKNTKINRFFHLKIPNVTELTFCLRLWKFEFLVIFQIPTFPFKIPFCEY